MNMIWYLQLMFGKSCQNNYKKNKGALKHSHECLVCDPAKNISYIQV
jgi:hypothetical protein